MTATAATEFTPQDVADFMRRHGCSEFYVQHYLRTMGRIPLDARLSTFICALAFRWRCSMNLRRKLFEFACLCAIAIVAWGYSIAF